MSAQSPMLQQASLLSGRQMVMLVIIALHALLISALMAMRIIPDVQSIKPPVIVDIYPTEKVVPPPPKEIAVVMKKPDLTAMQLPKPDVIFPVEESPTQLLVPTDTAPVEPPALPDPAGSSNVVPAIPVTALQFSAIRPADDYYPATSLRLGEEGTAIVQVCVAPTGRLEGNPTIRQSSGSPRLDTAALKWAGEALRFTPATRGGTPVSACKGFRVNFRLH